MIKTETNWLNDIEECDICTSKKEIRNLIILGSKSICEECYNNMTTQQQIEKKLSKLTTLEQLVKWMLSDEGRDPDNQRIWSQLPTFGGDEPKSGTSGIWSWDLDRVIQGECSDELSIETRRSLEELPF